ncbi:MAG TPA: hypothetical protein VGB92_11490 [Longimicrobium sp.]
MYDTEELLPPGRPAPSPNATPVWVVATLTVAALGVALGAAVPRNEAAAVPPVRKVAARPQQPRAAAPAAVNREPEAAPPAAQTPPGWMDLGPVEPGRSYAPVDGPTAVDEPALAAAPSLPVVPEPAPATGVSSGATPVATPLAPMPAAPAAALKEEEAAPAPRVRRSPAGSIRVSRAAELPLLAVRRGSGRIVFHEIAPGGTAGAELEGEWAVVGRCGQRLRLDLAQPARQAGAPRGVGVDVSSSGEWEAAVAVPGQGCSAGRTLTPRRATAAERSRFAASAGGFAPDELQQVASTEGAAWLVFAGRSKSRAVVMLFQDGAWREVWSREADGTQEIAAVLRRGGAWVGLFVTLRGGSPRTLQRVRVSDGGALPDAPAPLGG